MTKLFRWTTCNVVALLPADWQAQILRVADEEFVGHTLISSHSTSREVTTQEVLPVGSVGGRMLASRLPWLRKLYDGDFLDLAQAMSDEKVTTMVDDRFAMVLNVQRDGGRYECHVDTNPVEGLLYCTSHYGGGGELVVSNRGDVGSVGEVDEDCTLIEPRAGHLVFFDARHYSHYVRRLTDRADVRVVAALNYFTESSPEWEVRPPDLNRHLTGRD
jgi:hypothetical protein